MRLIKLNVACRVDGRRDRLSKDKPMDVPYAFKKAVKEVKVGKRGSIIIPAEIVQELGIGAEDNFTLRKSKSGVALKKVEA
jgi:AbrB family looped-hinge helix DNA binding protein